MKGGCVDDAGEGSQDRPNTSLDVPDSDDAEDDALGKFDVDPAVATSMGGHAQKEDRTGSRRTGSQCDQSAQARGMDCTRMEAPTGNKQKGNERLGEGRHEDVHQTVQGKNVD